MATIKSYTDIEQSKKLAEILPVESADMRYGYIAPYDYSDRMYDGGYDEIPYPKDFLIKNPNFSANEYDSELPCWSLAALISSIPQELFHGEYIIIITKGVNYEWVISYEPPYEFSSYINTSSYSLIDCCVEMIIKLKERKLL